MKNTTILIGIILVLGLVGGFVISGSGNGSSTATVVNTVTNADVQKITLGIQNYNYYPNTITVKAGQPVSITLDSNVKGCLRSFNVKDLGVSGYSQNPSQTIDFTPTQKGTFKFACSMGMGFGTLIVE